jgi:hypothetical protein
MNRLAETFVNLGLLKSEAVITDREPSELAAFNQANSAERAEILTNAEQVVIAGINSVRQAPETSQDQYTSAA